MEPKPYSTLPLSRISADEPCLLVDRLIREEPLEILLSHPQHPASAKSICVIMRTPGQDLQLALGFAFCEELLCSREEILGCEVRQLEANRILLCSAPASERNESRPQRTFPVSSSCGLCGKPSLQELPVIIGSLESNLPFPIPESLIRELPAKITSSQRLFAKTGGVHASALFTRAGELINLCEDIGRHNALDKLIGDSLLKGLLTENNCIILLSGRVSFELVQKASRAKIRILAAIGAPSSAAVQAAREANITLIGFLKSSCFNLYSGFETIELSTACKRDSQDLDPDGTVLQLWGECS
jgi:FdhD protein